MVESAKGGDGERTYSVKAWKSTESAPLAPVGLPLGGVSLPTVDVLKIGDRPRGLAPR